MEILHTFDAKNYDETLPVEYREAVRAIIINGRKLTLVKSEKYCEYKCPGGGKEQGEDNIDTLIRETLEETGLTIKCETIKEYGILKEIRKSEFSDAKFEHTSYYYTCEVFDTIGETNLDDYEAEDGYKMIYADIDEAISENRKLLDTDAFINAPWILRELYIFEDIKKCLIKC